MLRAGVADTLVLAVMPEAAGGGLMDEELRAQITRDDLLAAIDSLKRGEVHSFGPSTFYDLLLGFGPINLLPSRIVS
jgi:hypothetical protein